LSAVTAVIPAYNEQDTVGATITAVRRISLVDEIVVVDDGSSDKTADEARAAGADRVISLEHNKGKGSALEVGIGAASGETLLFIDADLGESASHAFHLVQAVVSGDADMAIAMLPAVQTKSGSRSGGFGLVLRLARWGIRRLGGRVMKAPLSGQRALRREVIGQSPKLDRGFGIEVGLTIDALRAGYRVEEIPAPLTHRATGRDIKGFLHRGRQFADVLSAFLRRVSFWSFCP